MVSYHPIIGIDISHRENRQSGYPVIEFNTRQLVRRGVLDKNHLVNLTVSRPAAWPAGVNRPGLTTDRLYAINQNISFNDLYEIFAREGDNVKRSINFKNCPIELENPDPHDLLQLVVVVTGYTQL